MSLYQWINSDAGAWCWIGFMVGVMACAGMFAVLAALGVIVEGSKADEVKRLRTSLIVAQEICQGLADRVAAQSELLAKRAEK